MGLPLSPSGTLSRYSRTLDILRHSTLLKLHLKLIYLNVLLTRDARYVYFCHLACYCFYCFYFYHLNCI